MSSFSLYYYNPVLSWDEYCAILLSFFTLLRFFSFHAAKEAGKHAYAKDQPQ